VETHANWDGGAFPILGIGNNQKGRIGVEIVDGGMRKRGNLRYVSRVRGPVKGRAFVFGGEQAADSYAHPRR
jgi:hypothetical protein